MQITLRGYLTFKPVLGKRQVVLGDHPPPTLQDLFALLEAEMGETFNHPVLNPGSSRERQMVILLNGQHIMHLPAGTETLLKDGDELSIFPPMAGG